MDVKSISNEYKHNWEAYVDDLHAETVLQILIFIPKSIECDIGTSALFGDNSIEELERLFLEEENQSEEDQKYNFEHTIDIEGNKFHASSVFLF